MQTTLSPLRVELIGEELAIAWNDGVESFIALEKLRRACPCAACGGEPDVLGRAARPEVTYRSQSFMLKSFRFIGGYAWQPIWADGHDSGLFAFALLRNIV